MAKQGEHLWLHGDVESGSRFRVYAKGIISGGNSIAHVFGLPGENLDCVRQNFDHRLERINRSSRASGQVQDY
jgi:murein L,D-transpeptidase YafK